MTMPQISYGSKEVQRLLDRIARRQRRSERRNEARIEISIPVVVIPCPNGEPDTERGLTTFTKNISAEGLAIICNRPLTELDVLIGFPGQEMSFVRATISSQKPLALGCRQVGLRMHDMIDPKMYPGLEKFRS